MRPFAYTSPATLDEALALLSQEGWRGQVTRRPRAGRNSVGNGKRTTPAHGQAAR